MQTVLERDIGFENALEEIEDTEIIEITGQRDLRWRKVEIEKIERVCELSSTEEFAAQTPLQYLKPFFSDAILTDIVYQSNLYSVQSDPNTPLNSDFSEMSKFVGINLLSSIVKLPQYRMYWAKSTRFPRIADVMPRNRFDVIKKILHFNDNDNMKERSDPEYDPLFKIRPFLIEVRNNFLKIEPEEMKGYDPRKNPTGYKWRYCSQTL